MENSLASKTEAHKPKLLDQVWQTCRFKHYSPRTEQTYVQWINCIVPD